MKNVNNIINNEGKLARIKRKTNLMVIRILIEYNYLT